LQIVVEIQYSLLCSHGIIGRRSSLGRFSPILSRLSAFTSDRTSRIPTRTFLVTLLQARDSCLDLFCRVPRDGQLPGLSFISNFSLGGRLGHDQDLRDGMIFTLGFERHGQESVQTELYIFQLSFQLNYIVSQILVWNHNTDLSVCRHV
jgi:hypothetical protein